MDDNLYADISAFLHSPADRRVWPSSVASKDKKRNFRQKCQTFKLEEGTLHKRHPKYQVLRVVKASEKEAILTACHSSPADGGHLGIDKVIKKVTERYYWSGMTDDVKAFSGKFITVLYLAVQKIW